MFPDKKTSRRLEAGDKPSFPTWRAWLAHAFAVSSPENRPLTVREQHILDVTCRTIHQRGLIAPALLFLQSSAPLGTLSAQCLVFLKPWLEAVLSQQDLECLITFLERPGAIESLCQRLEAEAASSSRLADSVPEKENA